MSEVLTFVPFVVESRTRQMTWKWSDFDTYDDQTIVPINLTSQEMALIISAISVMDNPDAWVDSFNYYNDAKIVIETIYDILGD